MSAWSGAEWEAKWTKPRVEREVADYVFACAEELGKQLSVSFEDPDYIIAAETLGEECGVALLDHGLRKPLSHRAGTIAIRPRDAAILAERCRA